MTTTDRDIRDHVAAALNEYVVEHDVEAIVRELIVKYDLTGDAPADSMEDLPGFWSIVESHRIDA